LNVTEINHLTYNYKSNNNQSFGNSALISSAFMAIDKHEIIGVSAIDLASMVIPRSIIDFTRNKEAGIETTFREGSSTATHAAIGVAGLGAAALLAQGLKNKNYNVDFKNITANDDTVDALAKVFKQIVDENPTIKSKEELSRKFLDRVFSDVKGLVGNADNNDAKLWYSLKQEKAIADGTKAVINPKESIIKILLDQQKTNKSFKLSSDTLSKLEAYMNIDIPSTQTLHVKLADKMVATKGSHFLADVYSLTKSFTQDNVIASFKKAKDSVSVEFVKDLEKLSIRKTVLGLAAICSVALSMQSINRHLTKKRTGKDGFVGDPDYDKNTNSADNVKKKNPMFVPLKLLSMLGMGFFIFKTLNASSLRDLASKLQFKGSLPTMNQIKVVYGSTILGRLFAASDTNELRESAFRDFLGFTNFLLLGAMVTKCFVNWKNKALINYDPAIHGKGLLNWLKNSTIKTHQEVVNESLKQHVITDKGVLSLKDLYKNNWIQNNGTVANKLSVLNKANLLGILYACVALGIVVPLINKHVTEYKNRKANKDNAQVSNNTTEQIQQNLTKTVNPEEKAKAKEIIANFLSTPQKA